MTSWLKLPKVILCESVHKLIFVIERLHHKYYNLYIHIGKLWNICMSCKRFSSINKCNAMQCTLLLFGAEHVVHTFFCALSFTRVVQKFVINGPIRTVLGGHGCMNCNEWFYCRFAVWQLKWYAQCAHTEN